MIRFGYDGKIDHYVTRQLIRAQAQQTPRFVIPGFYGALPNGRIKVMARGGSDITGQFNGFGRCLPGCTKTGLTSAGF